MIRLIKLFLLSALITIPYQSCELGEIISIDCSECYIDKPEWGAFEAGITINQENPFVKITTYHGAFEDNNVAYIDTAYSTNKLIWVDVNTKYSLVAEYMKDGRTYYVVSGGRLKVRLNNDACDRPCFYITGTRLDLRLKI
ncbi:MAG: hypothetical protein ACLFNU_08450 [Bacteroidales bacterium]